jgi:hypothetical protein
VSTKSELLTAVFVLIVAFIIPPHQAVVQVFEAYANMYFFAALSWAWVGAVMMNPADMFLVLLGYLYRQQSQSPHRSSESSCRRGAIVSSFTGVLEFFDDIALMQAQTRLSTNALS